jgi:hypothetical protein
MHISKNKFNKKNMETDLYFALRQISLAIGIVLHANQLIEVRSESSLRGFVNFLINQILPDVIDIRNAFIYHYYENLEEYHWKLIDTFNKSSKIVFPFRIHLSEIEDSVLLDSIRFAFCIFHENNSDLLSVLKLCSSDEDLIGFVKNILHNFDEYPHTCPDKLFLLNMRFSSVVQSSSKAEMARKSKKCCSKSNEGVKLKLAASDQRHSIFHVIIKKDKKGVPKGCTQTALQALGLLNKREKTRRDNVLGFSF